VFVAEFLSIWKAAPEQRAYSEELLKAKVAQLKAHHQELKQPETIIAIFDMFQRGQ